MAPQLAQMPTELAIAVLSTNFDSASLANRLSEVGVHASAECRHLVRHAHRALTCDSRLDSRLTGLLDRLSTERIQEVAGHDVDVIETWAAAADWESCPDFGRVLWAFARDPRAEVRASCRVLVWRMIEGATRPQSCSPPSDSSAS